MTEFDSGRENGTDDCTDLEERDVRALTRKATVLPLGGDVFDVTTESGRSYRVDVREGRCTCPDATHRDPECGCYHVRRGRYTTGRTPVPAWVDTDAVDPQLGDHVDGGPRVVATDGGSGSGVIDAGDDGEILRDDDDQEDADAVGVAGDGRPADCSCEAFHTDTELPCWPCDRDGFDDSATMEGDDV